MRAIVTLGLLLLAGAPVFGQAAQNITPSSFAPPNQLIGRKQAIYLVRCVDLTDEQRAAALDLLHNIYDPPDGWGYTIEQIRSMQVEMAAAEEAGDTERLMAIGEEIRSMAREDLRLRAQEFATSMTQLLNTKQRQIFDRAAKVLETHPNGELRKPAIMAAVARLELDDDMRAKVDRIVKAYDDAVAEGESTPDRLVALTIRLVRDIERELSPAQAGRFAYELRKRRADLIMVEGIDVAYPGIPEFIRRPRPNYESGPPGTRPRRVVPAELSTEIQRRPASTQPRGTGG